MEMHKILAIISLFLFVLLTPGSVTLDGLARGRGAGGVRLALGRRAVALAVVEYRPGRLYYRANVGSA